MTALTLNVQGWFTRRRERPAHDPRFSPLAQQPPHPAASMHHGGRFPPGYPPPDILGTVEEVERQQLKKKRGIFKKLLQKCEHAPAVRAVRAGGHRNAATDIRTRTRTSCWSEMQPTALPPTAPCLLLQSCGLQGEGSCLLSC